MSGRDELVVVAVDAVAQPPGGRFGRDRDRPHDLADLAAPAEQQPAPGHPAANAVGVAVELEGSWVDRRTLGPGDGRFGHHDAEEIDPPWRPVDDLEAAVAADRDVVLDDRPDLDAHDLHRGRW